MSAKLLEVVIELVGPIAETAHMKPQFVFEFGRRANRKRMPFVARDLWDLDEYVIARTEFKIRRTCDN